MWVNDKHLAIESMRSNQPVNKISFELRVEGGSLQFYQYVHLKKDEELKMNYWFHLWV